MNLVNEVMSLVPLVIMLGFSTTVALGKEHWYVDLNNPGSNPVFLPIFFLVIPILESRIAVGLEK